MNGQTETHLVQFRAVPSLLTACTNQPFSGKEAGLPSNRCRVRSASVSWAIWLWLFSGSLWGLEAQSPTEIVMWCGEMRAAVPGLWHIESIAVLGEQVASKSQWMVSASASSGGHGQGSVAWLKRVGDDRRIQMGLEWTRGGVGELQCGVAWSDFLAVGMSLPLFQPPSSPLRTKWKCTRTTFLGRRAVGRIDLDWTPGTRPAMRLSAGRDGWRCGAGSDGLWLGAAWQRSPTGRLWTWTAGWMRSGIPWVGIAWGQSAMFSQMSAVFRPSQISIVP